MSAIAELLRQLEPDELAEFADRLRPLIDQAAGEQLLTPIEAAGRLGVHPKTLTRAAAAGRVLGAVRVGKGWRFRAGELAMLPPAGVEAAPVAALSRRRSSGDNVAAAIRNGG